MKLLYFRIKKEIVSRRNEFVVLCDEQFVKATVKEHQGDGYELRVEADLITETGSEYELPQDRELTP